MFKKESREFYNIEKLWADAPSIEVFDPALVKAEEKKAKTVAKKTTTKTKSTKKTTAKKATAKTTKKKTTKE